MNVITNSVLLNQGMVQLVAASGHFFVTDTSQQTGSSTTVTGIDALFIRILPLPNNKYMFQVEPFSGKPEGNVQVDKLFATLQDGLRITLSRERIHIEGLGLGDILDIGLVSDPDDPLVVPLSESRNMLLNLDDLGHPDLVFHGLLIQRESEALCKLQLMFTAE